jgi:biotin carboxylase
LNGCAVIVDPYSDSREFARAFGARGVKTVAVLSNPEPLSSYATRWSPEEFHATHFFNGDFKSLAATVAGYDPICVIPGNEHAVELTAALVDALLPGTGNVPGMAAAQRHKGEMGLALDAAGIPRLHTICTDDPEEVTRWIGRSGLEGRALVLKPPKSGGTEDVHLACAGEDWRPYFDQVLGAVNRFDLRNDAVVVQEYAVGAEYIVDMYSVDGRHGLVNVCSYIRHSSEDRIGIYDAAIFEPPDHRDVPALAEYARLAADAVGIRNGSTHAEIMMTDRGPRLIEIAARLDGGCMMTAARLATGECQIDRAVRHYLDGEFTPDYKQIQQVRTVWLGTKTSGILRNMEILDKTRSLPTVHSMSLASNGQRVERTVDAFTEIGWMILAGPDEATVEADYQYIKELEQQVVVEPVAEHASA